TIVHWRDHYFLIMDKVQALENDEFNLICRWRTPYTAAFVGSAWESVSSNGNVFHIQNTQTQKLHQTGEYGQIDGAARPFTVCQYKNVKLAKGRTDSIQNLLFVSGDKRADRFEARRVRAGSALVRGTADGKSHIALIGIDGNMPLKEFETDAVVYVLAGNKLHLASVTNLKVRSASDLKEVFRASAPVNLLLDCATGKGEIEVNTPEEVRITLRGHATALEAGQGTTPINITKDGTVPGTTALLAKLWTDVGNGNSAPVSDKADREVFEKVVSGRPLEGPFQRIVNFKLEVSPEPVSPLYTLTDNQYSAHLPAYTPTWRQAGDIELKISLDKPTQLSHVRLVSTMDVRARGRKLYDAGDLKFSVIVSNDNFRKDIRKIANPAVTFEETEIYPIHHYDIGRLPTFRVDLNCTARYVKILPTAVNPAKPFVSIQEMELYSVKRSEDLAVKAFAVDINGDGGNELVVGTSNKEVAAYDADGKQLWARQVPGDIFTMDCADLDEDGRSEALVYTLMEQLHCFNGDGSERYRGDIYQAQLEKIGQHMLDMQSAAGGALAMGVWGPEDPTKKEVNLWSEVTFRVRADGKADVFEMDQGWRGSARLVNLYPGEPEVLATVGSSVTLWSARRGNDGNYIRLASKPTAGPAGAWLMHGFGWAQAIDLPGYKGVLAANEGGVNWYPIEAFLPNSSNNGWGFNTGGVPVVAAMVKDINGDKVPEVYLARQDGYINVLSLSDGKMIKLINTTEPILGIAGLNGKGGRGKIAVGTKMGVHLYGPTFKKIGRLAIPMAAFAGPAGKKKDAVFAVDAAGKVYVVRLK
ncbi:MAG: VCBS repeat-containing protein, partial [Planctomycetes bacterium]|nr:VCBS repeat-containing protein [Planctomycetota bacterium]